MKVLGVIQARGGSKRVPRKNVKLLAGKPLIAYMIEAAKAARKLDRLIVSSDDDEIINVAKEFGAEVPFKRPDELATSETPTEQVTQHAVNWMKENEDFDADIVVHMQPTTPFVIPEDIDGCIDELINADVESVVTASKILERPEWMFAIAEDGKAELILKGKLTDQRGNSQSMKELYIPNGGVYATYKEALFKNNSLYGETVKLWIMPHERSIDIDEPIDFEFAEFMLSKKMMKDNVV